MKDLTIKVPDSFTDAECKATLEWAAEFIERKIRTKLKPSAEDVAAAETEIEGLRDAMDVEVKPAPERI